MVFLYSTNQGKSNTAVIWLFEQCSFGGGWVASSAMKAKIFATAGLCTVLLLGLAAVMMRSEGPRARRVLEQEDPLDKMAERLIRRASPGKGGAGAEGRPRDGKLPAAFQPPDLAHGSYPTRAGEEYSATDHAIAAGRSRERNYDAGEGKVLRAAAEAAFGEYEDRLKAGKGVEWNKMGRMVTMKPEGSKVPTAFVSAMRKRMEVGERPPHSACPPCFAPRCCCTPAAASFRPPGPRRASRRWRSARCPPPPLCPG